MNPIKKFLDEHLQNLSSRLQEVASSYLLSLILPLGKRSMAHAEEVCNTSRSSYSSFLKKSRGDAELTLHEIVTKIASKTKRTPLVSKAPWTIAIIIDSTLHERSSLKVQNSQHHNHGDGYVTGHTWTNIVLHMGKKTLPLPPLPFYTKEYCRKHDIKYLSEHKRVAQWIRSVDLAKYVGVHDNSEIVVLLDSGYDGREIQKEIVGKGWDFIASLKKSDNAYIEDEKIGLEKLSSRAGFWHTVSCLNKKRTKRKDFRACVRQGKLVGLNRLLQLVCSQPRRDRQAKIKYLACSNVSIDLELIIHVFRIRWEVELFHKFTKSQLGMEDVAAHKFESINAHVLWVYVAYALLQMRSGDNRTLAQEQKKIHSEFEALKFKQVARLADRYGAPRLVKRHCYAVIQRLEAA